MKIQAALFKNNRKQKETHPDYKGQGELKTDDGKELLRGVELSGWAKTSKQKGTQYLSLVIRWKDEDVAKINVPPPEEKKEEPPALSGRDDHPF